MTKKHNISYCFSERLQAQLAKIPESFLTVVEAPSGSGKTTAIREYFAATRKRKAWYTCLGEPSAKTWAGICDLFGAEDDAITQELKALGVPMLETLPDIAALLRDFRCSEAYYVIIDNFQLFEIRVQKQFITALSTYPADKLHIIIITQPLEDDFDSAHLGVSCHSITTQDFFFDNACIAQYCRLAGTAISSEAIQQIQAASEGWVAAIRLQLKYYAESGSIMDAGAINALVEQAVWNKLSAGERDFMLAVSLLDGFTARQAAIMHSGASMPKRVTKLLSPDFFVRRLADKNMYSIHGILRDYLRERFSMQAQDAVDAMHRKAASACLAASDYFQAARFFQKVSDYDAMLSMPFTLQYFYDHKEVDVIEFFQNIIDVCPEKTLRNYPVLLVILAFQFMRNSMLPAFRKTVSLIEAVIDAPQGLKKKELARVQGEFALLMSFKQFNDITKMSEYHRKAFAYLKTDSEHPRSLVFRGVMPWILDATSVISVYWNKSGELYNALKAMDECLPFWTELTGGHGAGGEAIMRAEVCLAHGDDTDAETLCYKALYTAREAGQICNCLCAELVLAQIAILRGDEKAFSAARRNMASSTAEARQAALRPMGEMCLACLDMAIGKTDALPGWLGHAEAIRRIFYNLTQPQAMMLYGHWLLLEKRHAELYDMTDSVMQFARDMNYMLPQLCHLLCLAVARRRDSNNAEAVEHLREALAIALPDRVYLPFAVHGEALLPLLEGLQGDFDKGQMEDCIALCRRWNAGLTVLRGALSRVESTKTAEARSAEKTGEEKLRAFAAHYDLTEKQAEVLSYILQKLSIKVMAESMDISCSAVEKHVAKIFEKTDVKLQRYLRRLYADWKR